MRSDQQRWAFARDLIEIHGADVSAFIERRFQAMRSGGNDGGLQFWQDIAARIATLSGPGGGFWPQ